jgi:hypothetical protein
MAAALNALRSQALATAESFADYNFRTYFVRHTTELYDRVASKPATEVDVFVGTEGPKHLSQLRRMAAINSMYAETPVVLDTPRPVDATKP